MAGWGEGSTGFALGDRVCRLVGGGGYAEYCPLDYQMALPVLLEHLQVAEEVGAADGVMPFEEIARAHQRMEADLRCGKIILALP